MKHALLMLGLGTLIFAGCSTGHCRKSHTEKPQPEAAASADQNASKALPAGGNVAVKPSDRVRVFKYDGSLQCNQGKAIATADMQKDLKGIHVFSSESKRDSLMRIQQCGTPTGQANVFEIDRKDLDKAKSLGFQLWTFE